MSDKPGTPASTAGTPAPRMSPTLGGSFVRTGTFRDSPAPPQPASKARMTCSPELVGGALASQNGLGLLMPAKSIERSAMAWGSKDGRDAPARARRLAGRALREPANHSMAAAAGNDGPPRHPMAGARQNAGFPASSSSTASASWNWRFIAAGSR